MYWPKLDHKVTGNFKSTEESSLFLAAGYIVRPNKISVLFIGTQRKWMWGRSPAGPLWEMRPNLPRLPELMAPCNKQLTHSGFSLTGHVDTVQPLPYLPERTDLSTAQVVVPFPNCCTVQGSPQAARGPQAMGCHGQSALGVRALRGMHGAGMWLSWYNACLAFAKPWV